MKHAFVFVSVFLLFACKEAQLNDLHEFVASVKSKTYSIEGDLPKLREVEALAYINTEGKKPFSDVEIRKAIPKKRAAERCLLPYLKRKKQPLEAYCIDVLIMRGTLFVNHRLWGLIQVKNREIKTVKVGDYLGLNQGRIIKITKTEVELSELIQDENGCWQKKITQIRLQLKAD